MSAFPPEQIAVMRQTAEQALRPVDSLARRWAELHREAGVLAQLAQLGPESARPDADAFAAALGDAQEWQRELAWQAISDIDAMMQPGITALKVIAARGQVAVAPALALWREFQIARDGLLSIVSEKPASA